MEKLDALTVEESGGYHAIVLAPFETAHALQQRDIEAVHALMMRARAALVNTPARGYRQSRPEPLSVGNPSTYEDGTMSEHFRFKYGVRIKTDDSSLLGCMRGLSYVCDTNPHRQIASGGTGEDDWRRAGGQVVFRFTAVAHRDRFIAESRRLLPEGAWTIVALSDDDPAVPSRQHQVEWRAHPVVAVIAPPRSAETPLHRRQPIG